MSHTETNGFYDDNQNIENASPEKQVLFYKKRYIFRVTPIFVAYRTGSVLCCSTTSITASFFSITD